MQAASMKVPNVPACRVERQIIHRKCLPQPDVVPLQRRAQVIAAACAVAVGIEAPHLKLTRVAPVFLRAGVFCVC